MKANLFRCSLLAAHVALASCLFAGAELDRIREAQLDCRYPRISVHMGRADVHKRADAAMAFYNARLGDTNAEHRAQLVNLAELAVRAYLRAEDFDVVKDLSERFLADEKSPLGARLAAAEYLAVRAERVEKDAFKADRIYETVCSWKHFGDAGKLDYHAKRAALRGRQQGIDAELAYLRDLVANWEPAQYRDSFVHPRMAPYIAKVYERDMDYRGLFDFWKGEGNGVEALRVLFDGRHADDAEKERLSHELVSGAEKGKMPLVAWVYLFQNDEAFALKHLDAALGDTKASTNAVATALLNTFVRSDLLSVYGINSPTQYRNHELIVRTYGLYRRLRDTLGEPVAFDAAQYGAQGFAALQRPGEAVAALDAGLENAALKPAEAYQLKVARAILKGEDLAKVEPELARGLSATERADRFGRAGVIAILSEEPALQEAAAAYVKKCIDPDPVAKAYVVRYSERPIGGAGDWTNIPFKPDEDDFDRKFGGPGMDFMVTDVATGDRGEAVKGDGSVRKHPVTLQVVADEWGVHFLYSFYDRRARQFESGELDPGSFENYLAPGDNQPYVCYITYPKKDAEPFVMNTTYNMPGQRRVELQNRYTFRNDTVFADDRVMAYTAFSWDTYADHVPVDGGTWDFESIFWGPVPCAWNGTKSIHGRSTWGRLRFALGEKGRAQILRLQLFKAAKYYLDETKPAGHTKNSRGAQGGVFYFWNDAEYGDPDFYRTVLAPLRAELDAAAAKVTARMTDDDVRDLSERYLLRFRNIRDEVSRLRREYRRTDLLSGR